MFSGIVQTQGSVLDVRPYPCGGIRITVRCDGAAEQRLAAKDSVAINGVCLTATSVDNDAVGFDVVPETLARSALGELVKADSVNVEYALRAGDPIGGHFVYGHVDARARVIAVGDEGNGKRMRIALPEPLSPFLVEKGFIAVDGVSLTVAARGPQWFEVALIPETMSRTTLGERRAGSMVNLEVDPIARYAVGAALAAH